MQVEDFLVKDIVIGKEVNEQTESGIAPAAGCIAISLQRHEFAEERIKEIHKSEYNGFDFDM